MWSPFWRGMLDIFCLLLPISSAPLSHLSLCPWRLMEIASAWLHCPLVSSWVLPAGSSRGTGGERSVWSGFIPPAFSRWDPFRLVVSHGQRSQLQLDIPGFLVTSTSLCPFIPNCYEHISLVLSYPPTALKSPFIKLFSKYPIRHCHLFPAGALIGTVVMLGILFEEAVGKEGIFQGSALSR